MRKDPDVTGVVSVIGVTPINATPNAGRLAITLRSRDERQTPVNAVIERLQRAVAAVPGVVVFFRPVQDIQISTRLSRGQYQYTLTSTDANEVGDWATRLTQQLQKSEVLRDVASEAQDNGLGMDIQIDREMAGRLGVSMQTVVDTLSDAFGQRQISTIYGQANQYRVILEAKPEYQNDPTSLAKLYVPASGVQAVAQPTSLTSTSPTVIPTVSGAAMVPLSAIARYEHTTARLVVAHQEQFPAVTISFNLAPAAALSDAVGAISEAEHEIGMPSSVIGSYSGDAAEFAKSLAGEPWLILAAGRPDLHRAWRPLRKLHPPAHDLVDAAVGRRRRVARADALQAGPLRRRPHRHRAADGDREEERDHDDRLRARGRAQAGPLAAGVDRPGFAVAVPPDHDDHARGLVRRRPAGVRKRHRLGAAQSPRHHHHRRALLSQLLTLSFISRWNA